MLAAAVNGVLQLLHFHVAEVHPLPPLLHWLRDGALPLAGIATAVADRVARRSAAGGSEVLPSALSGALCTGSAAPGAVPSTVTCTGRPSGLVSATDCAAE